jgi:hypothetical protein
VKYSVGILVATCIVALASSSSCVPPPFTRTSTLPVEETIEQTASSLIGTWKSTHQSPPLGHKLVLMDTGIFVYELRPLLGKSTGTGMATGRWRAEDHGLLKLMLVDMKGGKYGAYSGIVGDMGNDTATFELLRDGIGTFSFAVTPSRLQITYDGSRYTYRRGTSESN